MQEGPVKEPDTGRSNLRSGTTSCMTRSTRNLAFLIPFLAAVGLHAQCPDTFSLGEDTTLCTGQTILLTAPVGYQSYLWDNGSTAQSRLVSTAGTYSCTVTDFGTSGELVLNGDFSAGATGFTSDYAPGLGGTYGLLSNAATYATGTSSQDLHSNYADCTDHTTGSGNLLGVNGAETLGQSVWCQTVAVQANTDYAFSAWLTSVFFESPAELQFTVNGTPVGTGLNATAQTCNWDNFYGIWPSGAATSATICITNLNTSESGNDFALDDISFAPFCTYTDEIVVTYQDLPEPDLGLDRNACADEVVSLNATWPNADSYAWQDGSGTPTLVAEASGTYWVDVTENGCTARDSVGVFIGPLPVVDLGTAQQRCAGDVALLNAFNEGASYVWQDGSTGSSYSVNQSGTYSVTVDLDGCTATDQVQFTYYPYPIVHLGNDTAICADTSLVLDAARPGGSYLWENGTNAPERTVVGGATYWVDVTEHGCTTRDSLKLDAIALPNVDLGPDFLLCAGTAETLDASGPEYNYAWSDGTDEPRSTITEEGEYGVVVENVCGMASDSIIVTTDLCDCPVFVPNAFTPNGDGFNDGFKPQFDCEQDLYHFRIYDRWGSIVWESEDALQAWKADTDVPNGVFAWTLEFRAQTVYERGTRRLTGHVVVVR